MNQESVAEGIDPTLVCVVDDDVTVLASYCALLESADFTPVPYTSGAMLLADDKHHRAGCIVLDLHMPPPDGIETLRRLRRLPDPPPVIMITGEGDIPTAVEAMRLGAFDFEEKPIDDDELIRLVQVAATRRSAPTQAGAASRAEVVVGADADGASRLDRLTMREKEVLDCLLEGGTNKEIARRLGISHRTVEVHRANIMEKTGAGSLSKLVLMAVDRRQRLA
jgi:two-component system response regulator FixJ